ncbi:MAG: RNA 2',3'-cyclic phosphodiesterase [Deltaproteobacteria bacterium]|nr:RNA 2',3'-cyclic phosphodiesterase [Deltaproteobacteria bacterium]
MIRAFVAVDLEPQTVQKSAEAIVQLRPRMPGIRCLSPANFHLTLKFLGDIDEAKVAPIAAALERDLYPFSCFTISAKGLGVFPHLKRPRILWVGLVGDELNVLASIVEKALIPFGFAAERRAFTPHLTVGRWREFKGSSKELGDEIEKWRGHDFGRSNVDEVLLFQSVLKPEGAVYRPLKTVALTKKAPQL